MSGFSRTVLLTTSSSSNGRKPLDIADIILAAYGREGTGFAAIDIVRRRREFAARDRVECVGEPLLRVGQHPGAIRRLGEQRHDTPRALEGEIHGLAQPPGRSALRGELLLGTDAVDGQLQGT